MENTFQRSEKTIRKQILIDGIESEVIRDAELVCDYDKHVYYTDANGKEYRVQFPRALRNVRQRYIADIYKRVLQSKVPGMPGTEFWSAYKGTIRNQEGQVIG